VKLPLSSAPRLVRKAFYLNEVFNADDSKVNTEDAPAMQARATTYFNDVVNLHGALLMRRAQSAP
jgi:hypothetical protein